MKEPEILRKKKGKVLRITLRRHIRKRMRVDSLISPPPSPRLTMKEIEKGEKDLMGI